MRKIKEFLEKLKRFLGKNKSWLLTLTFGGMLIDIFLFNFTNDLITLLLTGFWLLIIWVYKFKGKVSLEGGLGFLILCLTMLIFENNNSADKAAIWAYVFLVIGTIQAILAYWKENSGKTE